MTTTTAIDIVRAAFAAADAHDFETASPYFADDVEYHLLNLVPTHRPTFEGRDAYFDLVRMVDESSAGTYRYELVSLTPAGDQLVIVHGRTSASYDGREATGFDWVLVARVIDGVIVQMVDTPDTRLDEFWRPPA